MKPIKIVPLGVSGAGKTVYLASLYHALATPGPETCFTLRTESKFARELSKTYSETVSPELPWPRGTMGSQYRDFPFDCVVSKDKKSDYVISRLQYLDFPGGILTGEAEGNDEFFGRFDESDAYLVLLDGGKIYSALTGDTGEWRAFEKELTITMNLIGRNIYKPLHFVVTKWDLIEGRKNLDDVASILNGIMPFRNIVSTRNDYGLTTWLIPISAVGSNFARRLDDGTMEKIPDGTYHPYNVDVPISCLLHDLIVKAEIDAKEAISKSYWKRLLYNIFGARFAFAALGRILADFFPSPMPLSSVIRSFVNAGFGQIGEFVDRSELLSKITFRKKILAAESETAAFRLVMEAHSHQVFWLKRNYPASVLTGRK